MTTYEIIVWDLEKHKPIKEFCQEHEDLEEAVKAYQHLFHLIDMSKTYLELNKDEDGKGEVLLSTHPHIEQIL